SRHPISPLSPYTTLFRSDVLERGIAYVLECVSETGYIHDQGSRMYSHAFATLFLAEVYGMTQRADVRRALQSAVNIIVDSQNRRSEEHTSELQSRENLVC